MGKETDSPIILGVTTVLVNVGGQVPLVLTGTIDKITPLSSPRHHDSCDSPIVITGKIEGDFTEQEQFLILDVTAAILPPGFPLTIAQLTTDVAINLDSIILILPVEA